MIFIVLSVIVLIAVGVGARPKWGDYKNNI